MGRGGGRAGEGGAGRVGLVGGGRTAAERTRTGAGLGEETGAGLGEEAGAGAGAGPGPFHSGRLSCLPHMPHHERSDLRQNDSSAVVLVVLQLWLQSLSNTGNHQSHLLCCVGTIESSAIP